MSINIFCERQNAKVEPLFDARLQVVPSGQKNSRPLAPPGFIIRAAADFSGFDVQIFYNLGSYDSPESPL